MLLYNSDIYLLSRIWVVNSRTWQDAFANEKQGTHTFWACDLKCVNVSS